MVPVLLHSTLKFKKSLLSLNLELSGWSLDKAIKLAPKIVSGRVVNTLIFSFLSLILKSISQPYDFPIQFTCIVFTLFGQPSRSSKLSSRSLENSVMLKNHCDNFFLSTDAPDLHPFPLITCSFARTVFSIGSQFTYVSFREIRPAL